MGQTKKNFRQKLLRTLMVISILPLLALTLFSYLQLQEVIIRRVEAANIDRLAASGRIIDRSMETFFAMTGFIADNPKIQEILKKDAYVTYSELNEDRSAVSTIIGSLQATMNLGIPIYIVGHNPYARFTTTQLFTPLYADMNFNVFQPLDTLDDERITLTHMRVDGDSNNKVVLSIIQKIKSSTDESLLGYVIIDVYEDYFQEDLSPEPLINGRNTFLVDSDGVIITDEIYKQYTGYPFFEDLWQQILQANTPRCQLNYRHDNFTYLTYCERLPYSGYTLVQLIPQKEMYAENHHLTTVFIIAIVLLVAVVATVALQLSKRISTPLGELSQLMKQAEDGDLSVRFSEQCDDEIGQIGHSFNTMLFKIDELISELYTKQYMLKVAQLSNLKQQMNPHFIYNTLETIKWMTKLGNTEAINSTVVALGSILRYSLSEDTDMVSLGKELEQIYNYLLIQRLRHGQRFEMRIEVNEALCGCLIPKFLLQPLVENAIIHGLEPKVGSGSLIISAFREENTVHIQVSDNGVGLNVPSTKGHGIGLTNVRERIKLYYGKHYGITLQRIKEYTCAEITLPWREENSHAQSHDSR